MKVSCLPVSFFPSLIEGRMSVRDWARMAREAGLDGIDLSVLFIKHRTPAYLNKFKADLQAEGMPITMMATYPDFTHPDPLQRDREVDYLYGDIALASFLGAKYVRITAGQAHAETPIKMGEAWVIECFKKASFIAEKYGVTLLFENHSKPGAWDLMDFSYPTDIFLDIAGQLPGTGIKINFDTANTVVYGDDPLVVLKQVIAQVETVHAADTSAKGRLAPTLLGLGIVPFGAVFSLLKKHGFDGWICIEEASFMGRQGVLDATKFVREKWDEIYS
jgi:sugar phosphate isomerase/epimerase